MPNWQLGDVDHGVIVAVGRRAPGNAWVRPTAQGTQSDHGSTTELSTKELTISISPAEPDRAAARPRTQDWALQDALFFLYLFAVTSLLLFPGLAGGAVEHPAALVACHLLVAVMGGAAILSARRLNPVTRFIRWWYPVLLFTLCFEAVGRMIHMFQPGLIDARLVEADQYLFGAVLTPLLQSYARPWLTEIMYIFYSSYYFLIPGVGLALYFRGPTGTRGEPPLAFRKYLLAVSLTFWICYIHFLFTPAGGPVFWPDYPGSVSELTGGPVTAVEQWVFQHGTIVGGAFPSSHVAVAVVCAVFAVRFSVVPWLIVPLVCGLAVSTVYAGYHYGVDVFYGAILGALLTLAVEGLSRIEHAPVASDFRATARPATLDRPPQSGSLG